METLVKIKFGPNTPIQSPLLKTISILQSDIFQTNSTNIKCDEIIQNIERSFPFVEKLIVSSGIVEPNFENFEKLHTLSISRANSLRRPKIIVYFIFKIFEIFFKYFINSVQVY